MQALRVSGESHSLSDPSFFWTIARVCTQSVGSSVSVIISLASRSCSVCLRGFFLIQTVCYSVGCINKAFRVFISMTFKCHSAVLLKNFMCLMGLLSLVTAFTDAFTPFSTMPNSRPVFSPSIGTVSSEVRKSFRLSTRYAHVYDDIGHTSVVHLNTSEWFQKNTIVPQRRPIGVLLHVLMGIEFVSAPVYIFILIFNPATRTTSYHVGSVRSIPPILAHTTTHQDNLFSAKHHPFLAQTTHAVVGTSLGAARSTNSNHETSPEMTMFYHNAHFAPREGRISIMYRC